MIRTALVSLCLLVTFVSLRAQPMMDLETYLRQVEQAHPSIRAAAYEPDLAEAEIRNALGRFDPNLTLDYLYKDKSGSDKVNFLDGSLELPLNMLFGPKLKAEYRRGMGFQIDPENLTTTAGEASIGVALPLFQGVFTDKRRNQLNKALLRPEIAQAQYRSERNALLWKAGLAYWDWAEAETALDVAQEILELAQTRLAQIASKVRAGERAAIDSVEIAQEVQRRLGKRFEALQKAEQARVKASVYLWANDGSPQSLNASPSPLPERALSIPAPEEAINEARRSRPEIDRMTVMQDMARLDSSLAREFLRPFVELEAALLSYDVGQITSTDYKVGLKVSQPLLFRSASAGAQVADIGVQRADLSQILVLRVVEADAANAVVALQRSADQIDAALTEVDLALQMVEAERRLLDAGESSLLQINLRERFYAEALLRLISARADQARAQMTYRWATGTI